MTCQEACVPMCVAWVLFLDGLYCQLPLWCLEWSSYPGVAEIASISVPSSGLHFLFLFWYKTEGLDWQFPSFSLYNLIPKILKKKHRIIFVLGEGKQLNLLMSSMRWLYLTARCVEAHDLGTRTVFKSSTFTFLKALWNCQCCSILFNRPIKPWINYLREG